MGEIEHIPPLEERCWFCRKRKGTKLCDFVEGTIKTTLDFEEKSYTCDRLMCEKCATSLSEEFDFCPIHVKVTKEKLKMG